MVLRKVLLPPLQLKVHLQGCDSICFLSDPLECFTCGKLKFFYLLYTAIQSIHMAANEPLLPFPKRDYDDERSKPWPTILMQSRDTLEEN